ncbi:hypothetical protein Rhe02_80210 [Rhizocola hellebori]|uniref:Uncharacterized protein n=1 Tax=Rhizocola hellebori TaxID=1392758 RepID=A0A8J3VK10_9ACTN|nr:hypothetical protein [Rhizocola hellebori]GIH09954.1 hypothetical protein Rhe02_80210 [Rhizocola hellebori]
MSLDDLLGSADRSAEPVTPKRQRPRALMLLLQAAALVLVVFYGLRLMERTAPFLALVAGALTIVFGFDMVKALRPPPPGRQAGRFHEEKPTVPDGLNSAISRWDVMLDWCSTDVSRFNRRVLPRLGELVDERLRQKHGITRAADPEAARQILGDTLWGFVTMPSRRPPNPRDLDQIVTALEKL